MPRIEKPAHELRRDNRAPNAEALSKMAAPTSVALAAILACAAPAGAKDLAEFERSLPKTVGEMNQVRIAKTAAEGQVIAFYGGKAGRATVSVVPVSGEAGAGVTRAAQVALLEATAAELREGTKALGERYWTAPIQAHTLKIGDIEMACTKIEMRQGDEKGGIEQVRLLDRRCFTQSGGFVIGTYVTTPFKESMRVALEKEQLVFSGGIAAEMIKGKQ